jgi:hypothetical protein
MPGIDWNCCPLVAQNPIMRAFIEQIAKERKSRSTLENYSRDLNDFLSAFPDIPFSELIEADEGRIADYVDWLWKREAKQRAGQQRDRSKITYTSGSKLAPATIRRRISSADWNGPIFLSDSQRNPGQPLSKWTVKDIFDRIRDALHLPQLTPHKMRHLMLDSTQKKRNGVA